MWLMRSRPLSVPSGPGDPAFGDPAFGGTAPRAPEVVGAAEVAVGAVVVAVVVRPVVRPGDRPKPSCFVTIAASRPVASADRPGPTRRSLVWLGHQKTPAAPARVLVVLGLACLALVPSSSLPPGARNEYEYALNAKLQGAKQTQEGDIDQAEVLRWNLHAATIRPNKDGDVAAVPIVEQTQRGSP
jgi:hypothetical protein